MATWGRSGRTAEEAFTQLRAISQAEHLKLVEVAQQVIDEAVRRALARRNGPAGSAAGVDAP